MAQLLVRFYAILDAEGMFLTDSANAELADVGNKLCMLYSQLSVYAFQRRAKLWKSNPKLHLFQHLCEWQVAESGMNPKYFWVYADEDLVGHMIEVAQTCHPSTMAVTALFKWVTLAFVE